MRWGSTLAGAAGATAVVIGGQSVWSLRATHAEEAAMANLAVTPAQASAKIAMAKDGHFWVEANVNGAPIRALVDTGSTLVALTPADAEAIGLSPDELNFIDPVQTAAGEVHAARVSLPLVVVGEIAQRHVDGIVVPSGLEHSLLGMSFLSRLSRMEATPDGLVLRQ